MFKFSHNLFDLIIKLTVACFLDQPISGQCCDLLMKLATHCHHVVLSFSYNQCQYFLLKIPLCLCMLYNLHYRPLARLIDHPDRGLPSYKYNIPQPTQSVSCLAQGENEASSYSSGDSKPGQQVSYIQPGF